MSWLYKEKTIHSIEDFDEPKPFGFIYIVHHVPSGKKYLGKKVLFFERNVKLGKKELILLKEERKQNKVQGRIPTKKHVTSESDWLTYYGSSSQIKTLVKNKPKEEFIKEIIHLCYSKKSLSYWETKMLFERDVLHSDIWLNDNISGKYFSEDIL
jgi:hypothetical protein